MVQPDYVGSENEGRAELAPVNIKVSGLTENNESNITLGFRRHYRGKIAVHVTVVLAEVGVA